jgi:hypothetical protein
MGKKGNAYEASRKARRTVLVLDGRLVLKFILVKLEGRKWVRFIVLRILTSVLPL